MTSGAGSPAAGGVEATSTGSSANTRLWSLTSVEHSTTRHPGGAVIVKLELSLTVQCFGSGSPAANEVAMERSAAPARVAHRTRLVMTGSPPALPPHERARVPSYNASSRDGQHPD